VGAEVTHENEKIRKNRNENIGKKLREVMSNIFFCVEA
jgi:hypothetical protein